MIEHGKCLKMNVTPPNPSWHLKPRSNNRLCEQLVVVVISQVDAVGNVASCDRVSSLSKLENTGHSIHPHTIM